MASANSKRKDCDDFRVVRSPLRSGTPPPGPTLGPTPACHGDQGQQRVSDPDIGGVYATQMRHWLLAIGLVLANGCNGFDHSDSDDARTTDGRPAIDAAHDGGVLATDARPAVTTDVVCQPYTRTVQLATGARTVTTVRYATVATVGPEDVFAVETCGSFVTSEPPLSDCPAGATCTGSSAPAGTQCNRSYRAGTFLDGKLLVWCGFTSESYAADGTLTSRTTTGFTSVRLTVY